METKVKEKYLFEAFTFVLILKLFNSLWQISVGFLILFDRNLLGNIIGWSSREILEGDHLFWARHTYNILTKITPNTAVYIAFYFIAQALLKILLVTGLLKKKLWVYPTSIGIFFAFVCYQMFRYIHSHSHPVIMVLLSLLDLITILLIEHEYEVLKKVDSKVFVS